MSANRRMPPNSLSHSPLMSPLPNKASFSEKPFTSSRVYMTGLSSTWWRCTRPVISPLNLTAWNWMISMMYCRLMLLKSTRQLSVPDLPIRPLARTYWSWCSNKNYVHLRCLGRWQLPKDVFSKWYHSKRFGWAVCWYVCLAFLLIPVSRNMPRHLSVH